MYILQLLEARKLTQVDLQLIMKMTNILVNQTVASTLAEAAQSLSNEGCNHVATLENLVRIYSTPLTAPNIFAGLGTQYSQRKCFQNRYNLISPVKVYLRNRIEDFGRNRIRKCQSQKRQSYVRVPLIPQLNAFLNLKGVFVESFKDKSSREGVLSYFEDGIAFKENALFKRYPKSLQIHLYIDEAQPCDSLGSRTINNKLVFVYCSLGNIESKYRSALKHIFLLAIFYNHQVTKYGLNVLLQPIIDEFKKLEAGVEFVIHGKVIKMFGTVSIVSADNLASHAVGGFKIGFASGYRKCRYCLATDKKIQSKFSDSEFIPRTKKDHDLHCQGLDTELADYFSRIYGINDTSVLNQLKYYHVIGGLAPDVMHDVLEGFLPLTICEVLKYFIFEKKYFTIEELNHAVRNFDYGHANAKNKPSFIDISHINRKKLRQSASQIWCLAIFLPMMIGSVVPIEDPVWACYTDLLEITRLIFKTSISEVELEILESLISDYLTAFKDCFKRRITPKMHFLVHYPRLIRLLGPLGTFWCMRYEAKHSYFKQLSRSIGNYINLPWTLSCRHQQWQCYNFVTSKQLKQNFFTFEIELPLVPVKKTTSICFHAFLRCQGQLADMLSIPNLNIDIVNRFKWIKIASNLLKVGESVVLCPLKGSVEKDFGLIVGIIQYEDKHILLCEMYQTIIFNNHFQAFHVRKRKDNFHLAVYYADLPDHRSFCINNPVDLTINSSSNVNLEDLYVVLK